eukprot:1891318-Rhodomonas_salina.4
MATWPLPIKATSASTPCTIPVVSTGHCIAAVGPYGISVRGTGMGMVRTSSSRTSTVHYEGTGYRIAVLGLFAMRVPAMAMLGLDAMRVHSIIRRKD